MKRITKILLCVLCAVAAVLCVAAACFMLLKKQSGTTANSAASGASVSTYGKVSDFDYASFDYSEGLDDNGHWTGIRALDYVTLPEDVSALPLSKADIEPTEAEIQTQIDTLLNQYATTQNITDRAAQSGDTVNIDYSGAVDGVAFTGGTATGYDLTLGSHTFIDGFEDQIIGLKAGDEKDLDITFPEDYVADLAGKAVVFKVKVKEVKESQLPTVDDEFAKDVSEFETLADFKKDLGEKLTQRRTAEAQNDFEQAILEQLVDNLEADIPNGMVETQLDKIMDEYAMRMSSQGMSMDDYLKMMGMTPEMMRASSKPAALNQVKTELALEAVAAAENLEITDEECEAEVNKLAEQYKLTAEQVKAAVSLDALKHDLRLQKASELVVAEAKVGEAPKKEEEAAEKPKKATRKKKTEEAAEESESAEKPKRTRKKKAEESAEEPKAEIRSRGGLGPPRAYPSVPSACSRQKSGIIFRPGGHTLVSPSEKEYIV